MTYDLAAEQAKQDMEDAIELAITNAKNDYYRFHDAANAISYLLVDENCDQENSIEKGFGTLEFWKSMLGSAKMAAQYRSEDYGICIKGLC